ncbi:MAG: type VI secretion system tip protein VgrG [Deltaproteobacteria bacterium]|nr:type VI secretion system tip protein VgrG [Deltaproteobacteria bacterium]
MDVLDVLSNAVLPEVSLDFAGADGQPWQVAFARIREALSEPYECSLILTLPTPGAEPDGLLGGAAVVEIRRGLRSRKVQGLVRRVEDLGTTATHRYVRVVVVPALWTLSQRVDSRIFQDLPVSAIVRKVLQSAGVYQGDGAAVIPGSLDALPPRIYCVQHHESDLDFVLRLLQEEGIPFYFRHDGEGGETLVLAEDAARWDEVAPMEGGAFGVTDAASHVKRGESVQWFDLCAAIEPTSRTVRDYDFTRPRAMLSLTASHPGAKGARPVYDHPSRLNMHQYSAGSHTHEAHDGARQARIRHEAEHLATRTGRGLGNVTGFAPGSVFEASGHHRSDGDGRFLLTRVEHLVQAWGDLPEDVRASEHLSGALREAGVSGREGRESARRYVNHFECIPAAVPFRPARVTPRPLVHGSQTAKVVGPPGEEIHVDFHGRIKVQFHWDRQGREDEHSSCWMRAAQNWAGPSWGFVFTPRIGMEVVVTFLDGDPDRPLVTGCAYNGENHVPYGLPGEKSKSVIKTRSTPGGNGYNELRFEDLADQEEVYLRAQKDLNEWVLHDQSTKVDNNQSLVVGKHRTKTVKANEKNTIEKNRTTQVNANDSLEVKDNLDITVHGSRGMTTQVDETCYVRADGRIVLECGGSTIIMTPDSITLSSQTITVLGEQEVVVRGGVVKIN